MNSECKLLSSLLLFRRYVTLTATSGHIYRIPKCRVVFVSTLCPLEYEREIWFPSTWNKQAKLIMID